MKIKLWEFEYEFDRDDAKVAVPIAILLTAILTTDLNRSTLIALTCAYYILYFFGALCSMRSTVIVSDNN